MRVVTLSTLLFYYSNLVLAGGGGQPVEGDDIQKTITATVTTTATLTVISTLLSTVTAILTPTVTVTSQVPSHTEWIPVDVPQTTITVFSTQTQTQTLTETPTSGVPWHWVLENAFRKAERAKNVSMVTPKPQMYPNSHQIRYSPRPMNVSGEEQGHAFFNSSLFRKNGTTDEEQISAQLYQFYGTVLDKTSTIALKLKSI
jgi:hypothetical protein